MGDVRKNFSDDLYQSNNTRAINAVQRLLTNRGWSCNIDETYGADIVATMGDIIMYHEVEIKNVWDGPWPDQWATVQIPYRKQRLFDHYPEGNIVFWVVRDDTAEAWAMDGLIVKHSPVVVVPNRYIDDGEKFFQVPTDKALLVRLS